VRRALVEFRIAHPHACAWLVILCLVVWALLWTLT
jgi:hypothetical protein